MRLWLPDGTLLPHDQTPMAEALKSGISSRNREVTIERPDGSRVVLSVNIDPLLDAHGNRCGAINVFEDITEAKRAEENLRQSQKAEEARRVELETLMEAVPAVVWIAHDRECRRITGNRAGYEFLRLSGQSNLSMTAQPDERPAHFQIFKNNQSVPDSELPMQKAARTGRAIYDEELEIRFADGAVRWIFGSVVPLPDEQGGVRGVIATFLDITDKKRAEEKLELTVAERTAQLRDTVAELEAFSYSIAHDMRAPLRAMTTFSRLLEENLAERSTADGKDYARRIAVAAERLDRLIQDVLNYSKISRGEVPLETLDVEKLTREIIDSYAHLRVAGATILIQSPMPLALANPAALTQCISNLLSNAVKFVSPGTKPHIRIWAEPNDEWVRFWIEDNGIGISKGGAGTDD
jgi:PAS domain S-box-containing protein